MPTDPNPTISDSPARQGSQRLRIAETFLSVQGEGSLTGVPSFFIRTTGCNLRCWFCDTPYTSWSAEGTWQSLDDLLAQAIASGAGHVILTGGEPLLQPAIVELSHALKAAGLHITVETAGTVDRPVVADLMSISPKLANSDPSAAPDDAVNLTTGQGRASAVARKHSELRWNIATLTRLTTDYAYQLKFVIDTPADLEALSRALDDLPHIDRQHVWLMPQGITQAELAACGEWLRPQAEALGHRFCPRLHIEWFGHRRGV
jgi:7-carboxy-7-deazaguanine synthase